VGKEKLSGFLTVCRVAGNATECRCGLFFCRPTCSGKGAEHAQGRRNKGNCHSFPFTWIYHIINQSL